MNILYLIPARGGSKGVHQKNIKLLAGKPLICYSIDVARQLAPDENICLSTDDINIIDVVENYGLKVPFVRPEELASDEATTDDVIKHAINFYNSKNIAYDIIVLLQPTSPLRTVTEIKEAIALYENSLDMVVSVKKSKTASVLCSENPTGFLELVINKNALRRQDMREFYEYNGAIYVINVNKFLEVGLRGFTRKKKYIMNESSSIDIDTFLDFTIAELLIKENNKQLD